MARSGEDREGEKESERPGCTRKVLKKTWPGGQGPRVSGSQESLVLRGDKDPAA